LPPPWRPPPATPLPPTPTPAPPEVLADFQRSTAYLGHHSDVLSEAVEFATQAHTGQRRKSGESFIIHPIETAIILAEMRMDCDTIVAGLLHDTVEDTQVSVQDIHDAFGSSVAAIVSGVTDGKSMPEAVTLRERLLAMSADFRVVLVKLADRLHNMRTLQHMPPPKRVNKARETVSLYVPLAGRLGVPLEHELLDLSSSHLFPHLRARVPGAVLGRAARLKCPSLLDGVLAADHVLFASDVDAKLHSHRRRWAEHVATAWHVDNAVHGSRLRL